ncbi:MAG: PKD domain-containing protein, partial [Flavobacteriia bacterium]|nr:PKD domain-containing protein [Flavobacteriia bacterium]
IACTSTSAVLTVFVNNVSPSVIASNQTICSGGDPTAFTVTTPATGTGALSYQWQSSTTSAAAGFSDIAGATNATYDAPSGLTTTNYYKVISISTLNCVPCSAKSNVLNIYVNSLPILTIPSVVTICNNQTVNLNLTASNNSTFVWIAQNNNLVNGESILPQTSNIIDDLLTNNTSSTQYLVYTITPTSNPEGCVGPASSLTVQVQPNVLLNIPQNLEICSGSAVNAVLNANVSSNFQWFVSINNPNVNGESLISNTSNIISDILINNTTTNQVVIYSVFPISVLGICNGQAQTITIIVKPQLALLNTDTLTICSNESVNLNLVANTNVTLNWYADQSLNVINETTSVTTSSIINDVLINSTGQVQEVTYNVTGTSTIDGCSTPIIPITVFVNPLPTVNPSADLNLCDDIVTNPILFTGNVIGSVYSWATTSLNLGIPTLTGINSIPSFSTTNSGLSPISSIVEVTPIFINNNIQCEGPIDQFTITVNPVPSVFPVSNIILCEGELSSSVILLGTLGGTIFNWVNSNVSVGLASPGTGNIPVFTAQNPTLLPIQSTITVTPLYGLAQCPGDDILFDITVKPAPTINPQTVSICSGETLDINLSADLPCTFQWFATPNLNVLNETYTPTQNTDIINDILVQTTTIPQTVQYNISAISTQYNCESSSIIFNVIVNPLPAPSFTILNPPFCDLSPISFQNNTTGILDFTWSFGDGLYSNLYSPSHQFPTFGSYDVQLNAINPQTLCTNNIMYQIIISPTPSAVFSYSDSLGCDVLDVTYTAVSSNPTWGYLWDFGNGETLQQASSVGYQFDLEGCYDVSLTVTNNNGCTATQLYTDIACVYESPIASFSTDQDVLNEIDPLVSFYNNSVNASSFEWEFGDGTNSFAENPIHTYPDDAASYLVTLVAYNEISCTDSASIRIIILKDVGLYVPNSFTPDGDEYNHTFYPILTEGFKKDSYHMSIFDRWGELVFESYDPSFGWNGTYGKNGIQCQIGTYTWVIEVIELQSAVNRKFNGHLNLIR